MDIGTDISSDWSLNGNGDLNLVADNDNIVQTIRNRLSCYLPNFKIYYDFYGGFLSEYFGRRRVEETLEFMKVEIDTILSQETRIQNVTTDLSYAKDGSVCVKLAYTIKDEEYELNLVLDGEQIIVEGVDE